MLRLVFYYVLLLILLFLLAIFIYYYFLLKRKIIINKRLNKDSIYKEENHSKIFDTIFNSLDNFIKKVSKLLSKSKIINKYSLKYQKYINKDNKNYVDKMDFVSRKLLLALVFILVVLIFNIFRNKNCSLIQVIIAFVIGFYFLDLLLLSYNRILKKDIYKLKNKEIKSSGYVVDTLEAVLWVILNTNDFSSSILTAVNLGEDTDTIGAITGSISGLIYNFEDIPSKWIENLKKKDYLIDVSNRFEKIISMEEF